MRAKEIVPARALSLSFCQFLLLVFLGFVLLMSTSHGLSALVSSASLCSFCL